MSPARTWRQRQEQQARRKRIAEFILAGLCLLMVGGAVAAGIMQVNKAHAGRNIGGASAHHE